MKPVEIEFLMKDGLSKGVDKSREGIEQLLDASRRLGEVLSQSGEEGARASDKYNSKLSGKSDWQLTTQLGVAYKFAGKKSKKAAEPKEVWETRKDTIWYDRNEKDAARKFRIKDVHYRVK